MQSFLSAHATRAIRTKAVVLAKPRTNPGEKLTFGKKLRKQKKQRVNSCFSGANFLRDIQGLFLSMLLQCVANFKAKLFFFSFSSLSRCEINRAGRKKAKFLEGFEGTGLFRAGTES